MSRRALAMQFLESLIQDVRYDLRALRRSPHACSINGRRTGFTRSPVGLSSTDASSAFLNLRRSCREFINNPVRLIGFVASIPKYYLHRALDRSACR